MRNLLVAVILPLALLSLQPSFLPAQSLGDTTGTLAGEILDNSASLLPGVSIIISGPEGTKNATSDANGKFIFPYLHPGSYEISAELTGFDTIQQTNVRVGLGQRIEFSFVMKESVHENVTVG